MLLGITGSALAIAGILYGLCVGTGGAGKEPIDPATGTSARWPPRRPVASSARQLRIDLPLADHVAGRPAGGPDPIHGKSPGGPQRKVATRTGWPHARPDLRDHGGALLLPG